MSISKVYQIITDRIIGMLKDGVVPWRRPWVHGEPMNLISKKPYRGINAFILSTASYASPYFLTFNQVKKLNGQVRKGEKSWPVIFWRRIPKEDAEGNQKFIPLLRYYAVFNSEQVDGIEVPTTTTAHEPNFECEGVTMCYPDPPTITNGKRAFYRPSEDLVCIPKQSSFESLDSYYATLFHELVHSTGHDKRLSRRGITDQIMFGSHAYSREELVAECGSAFLCAEAGITPNTIENSAAYIKGWLRSLQDDVKLVVEAAAAAQRAADHILDRKFEDEAHEE